ncbi:unnamed protein product [Rotaria socialis]|uniref:Uncharacterized protein n=1 Tax=Rotaria socialis TaxID=392032 RepID=A0A820Q6D9_9BILA|nr:unnamed protein product [Rotaria socialis]CAF4416533.1 unnamed protein product [Rotaria socialis]
MISNIYPSNRIVSTNQCCICQQAFLFGALVLRYSDIGTRTYMYYHPTCLQCIKCQRKFLKDDKNFFNMIYYSGKFRFDQVLCDQCRLNILTKHPLEEETFVKEKSNKTNSYRSFNKADVHDYGQLLFERFTHRYKVDHQEIDLKTDDDNYHGSCYGHDVIDIRKLNDCKKSDLNASLTCCQKDWSGIDNINIKQCVRCHKTFTRFDIYQTLNHTKHYCNICWIYQKEFVIKNEKQSSFIRCNLCGQLLLDQLTDDIIAMNFVHPKCLEKHLDE